MTDKVGHEHTLDNRLLHGTATTSNGMLSATLLQHLQQQ
jgi:hypothetical protein